MEPNNFYTTEEVNVDPVKRSKLKSNEYALITSIPKDGNDLVDKRLSDSHHIKSVYFDNEDEYAESLKLNQDEHYSKIIEKLNETEELMTIHQNLEHTYDQYVTEYSSYIAKM